MSEEKVKPLFEKPGITIACDLETLENLKTLVKNTCCIQGVMAYKIGFSLVMKYGVSAVMGAIRTYTKLPVIYDHQKAATDIPDTGELFAKILADAKVDAVILFPFGGAETEESWIKSCQEKGLTVMVGGHMTQPKFLESEGGFISDGAPDKIYEIAARLGVVDFIVPGNKIELVKKYKELLDELIGPGKYSLSAPGFIKQGGVVSDFAKEAGPIWCAIVGRAIFDAEDQRVAAIRVASAL